MRTLTFFLVGESVATPLWGKCEVATHTPKNGTWESSGTPENSKNDCKGQKNLHWNFFIPLERSWNVDVRNDLAWTIWTSTAQVIGQRKAGSQIANQTGSLTPDH